MAFENFNPGRLNKRITIFKPGASEPDEDGFDVVGEEEEILSCHAQVTDESGTKAIESGSEFSVARRRFLIRHTKKALNTDMWIRYNGEDYEIVRPPNTYGDGGRFIELWTERRVRV